VKPGKTTKALNCLCGTTAVVLLVTGFAAALVTGVVALWLTAAGIPFWTELAWFATAMCVLAPLLFLYSYDAWRKKHALD
jgi:hypothetical protein